MAGVGAASAAARTAPRASALAMGTEKARAGAPLRLDGLQRAPQLEVSSWPNGKGGTP